jgi:hypothetical protein
VAKQLTRAEADRKRRQAASLMERVGEPDGAEEFERMSTDEYAERKGLRLTNPSTAQRRRAMATTSAASKTELQDQIDDAIDLLDDACARRVPAKNLPKL